MTLYHREEDLIEALKPHLKAKTWIFFKGEPGVGKTTFSKSLGVLFGIDQTQIQSPTFTLLNYYTPSHTFDLILHFDFYRLKEIEELDYLGLEDYFQTNFLALVEWSERFTEMEWKAFFSKRNLPFQVISLEIKYDGENTRRYLLSL